MPRPFDYTFLKFNDNGFVRERRNGCRGVFEIIDGGVAVRPRRVHGAKRRVVAEHALLRFGAVVEDERSDNADPFVALHGAEFHLGVRGDLLCYALAFARLDIQFAFKQMDGAERPHARLDSFDGGKIVRFGGFQKFIDAIHGGSSLNSILDYNNYNMVFAQRQEAGKRLQRFCLTLIRGTGYNENGAEKILQARKKTMQCPSVKECICPKLSCKNHGRCCDCVIKHRETDSLPYCLFPDNGGDKSNENHYRVLKRRFEGERK